MKYQCPQSHSCEQLLEITLAGAAEVVGEGEVHHHQEAEEEAVEDDGEVARLSARSFCC